MIVRAMGLDLEELTLTKLHGQECAGGEKRFRVAAPEFARRLSGQQVSCRRLTPSLPGPQRGSVGHVRHATCYFSSAIDWSNAMKRQAILICVISASLLAAANAQTPESSQARPDARYPNPSGHDSNPSQTTVKPTTTAPASKNPEDARTSTKGAAASQTYQTGKKKDDSAGCSTPTDAASAGVKTPNRDPNARADGNRTVCTTSGSEGVSATEKPTGGYTPDDKGDSAKQKKSASSAKPDQPAPR
jgi:hypothetical protein